MKHILLAIDLYQGWVNAPTIAYCAALARATETPRRRFGLTPAEYLRICIEAEACSADLPPMSDTEMTLALAAEFYADRRDQSALQYPA